MSTKYKLRITGDCSMASSLKKSTNPMYCQATAKASGSVTYNQTGCLFGRYTIKNSSLFS